MAVNNDEIERRAKAMLEEENKRDKQEKFDRDLVVILNELASIGKELKEAQSQIKRLLSEYKGEEIEIPYEVTDEQINDPESLGNLDTLEEMAKYYKECFDQAFDLSKSARKHRERKFYGVINKPYLKAYDLSSKMFAKVNSFYKKYQDILDARNAEEVLPPTDLEEKEEPEVIVNPEPEEEKKKDSEVVVTPVPEEEKEEPEVVVTPEPEKKSNKPNPDMPGLLDGIDPKYYEVIFNVIKSTVVIGNKYKFNTLEYMQYSLQTVNIESLRVLGFPVEDIEKVDLIKEICLRLVDESIKIRRDQWLAASNENKQGTFNGRKHSTQAAIVDRNNRIIQSLNIDAEIAAQYGIVTDLEKLKEQKIVKEKDRELVSSVKDDKVFADFYQKFKTIYKLGSPTSESEDVLYKIYEDLKKDKNSFNLTGESLKAARVLVEKTIYARRNSWQSGKTESKKAIEEIQKELGL